MDVICQQILPGQVIRLCSNLHSICSHFIVATILNAVVMAANYRLTYTRHLPTGRGVKSQYAVS